MDLGLDRREMLRDVQPLVEVVDSLGELLVEAVDLLLQPFVQGLYSLVKPFAHPVDLLIEPPDLSELA